MFHFVDVVPSSNVRPSVPVQPANLYPEGVLSAFTVTVAPLLKFPVVLPLSKVPLVTVTVLLLGFTVKLTSAIAGLVTPSDLHHMPH